MTMPVIYVVECRGFILRHRSGHHWASPRKSRNAGHFLRFRSAPTMTELFEFSSPTTESDIKK